jgi:hypothetical protein
MSPLALPHAGAVALGVVGAVVVLLALLWVLGLIFEIAVDADNRAVKGAMVLFTAVLISLYVSGLRLVFS